jgi:hypothetical protein
MKLQELAVTNPTKQAAKVFESYFGDRVKFNTFTRTQAHTMLSRVRALVSEHRSSPDFYRSEQDADYLKLIVMEQALTARIMEQDPVNAQQQQALQAAQVQQKKRQIQDAIKAKQSEIADLQKAMNDPTAAMPMAESSRVRRLREASEIQQAQVVLASQDMVDQVQKMSEQVSAMQFKDLPALVDQIKNEIGVPQATQFNTDATAALTELLQNLQGSKATLEQALGVVTGQAVAMPALGAAGAAPVPDMPVVPGEEQVDIDATEIEPEPEPEEKTSVGLGRQRR